MALRVGGTRLYAANLGIGSRASYSTDYDYDDDGEDEVRFWLSWRFGLAVLGFAGFFIASSQRVCLKFAMESMVQSRHHADINGYNSENDSIVTWSDVTATQFLTTDMRANSSVNDMCPITELFRTNHPNRTRYYKILPYVVQGGDLNWHRFEQDFVLRAYAWGFVFTQLPSGWSAEQFGGKRTFGIAMFAASIATMMIPLAAAGTHYFVVLILRFIVGIGTGSAFPAMHALWGKWAPAHERSRLVCLTYSGAILGNVIAFPLTEVLCQFGFGAGWPSVFYLIGGAGVFWFFLWLLFTAETPSQHPLLGKLERQYLYDELSGQTTLHARNGCKTPWLRLLASPPFLSIVVAHFAYEWGLYTFEYCVPEFFKYILVMDVRNRGAFSVVPYFSMWVFILLAGIWGDRLIYWGLLGKGGTRKFLQTIGAVVPGALIIGLGFLDCRQWRGAVAMVMIAMSFVGFQFNGFLVSHLDIAPQYAGLLMGIGSSVAVTAPIVAPFVVEQLKDSNTDVEDWQLVFYVTASLYAFGILCFIAFGSGRLQSWAEPRSESISTTASSGKEKLDQLNADGPVAFVQTSSPLGGDELAVNADLQYGEHGPHNLHPPLPITDSISYTTSSLSSLDYNTLSRYKDLNESLV